MPYPATATLPPLFAVQRLADGQWLVRTPMGDPILPGSRQNHWRISSANVQTRPHPDERDATAHYERSGPAPAGPPLPSARLRLNQTAQPR
jgi:hypothetical protein